MSALCVECHKYVAAACVSNSSEGTALKPLKLGGLLRNYEDAGSKCLRCVWELRDGFSSCMGCGFDLPNHSKFHLSYSIEDGVDSGSEVKSPVSEFPIPQLHEQLYTPSYQATPSIIPSVDEFWCTTLYFKP